MKIIDGKGMLFGKINIIDFLVLVFLLSLAPLFYYSYKLFANKESRVPKEYIEMVIPCNFIKVNPEITPLILAGDEEFDSKGKSLGKITWAGVPRPLTYNIDMGKDQIKKVYDVVLKEVPAEVTLRCERRKNKIYYKNEIVQVDSSFIFSTSKYSLQCTPIKSYLSKWVNIKVRFPGVSPEISKMINFGHLENNNEGEIIAKLNEIVSNTASRLPVVKTEDGKLIFIEDPCSKDIVAKFDILCEEKNGTLLFKNFPVKVGTQITFMSNSYMVSGIITEMEDTGEKPAD